MTALLKTIAERLSQLLQALEAEYQALSANDVEKMQQTAEDKTTLTEQLERLELKRSILLKNAGLDQDKTGMTAYLQRQPDADNAMEKHWQEIEQITRKCEKQNKVNGIIIESKRRRANTALAILKGQSNTTELYTAEGTAVAPQNPRTIARA